MTEEEAVTIVDGDPSDAAVHPLAWIDVARTLRQTLAEAQAENARLVGVEIENVSRKLLRMQERWHASDEGGGGSTYGDDHSWPH